MAYDHDDDAAQPTSLPPAVAGTIFFARVLLGLYFLLAGLAKAAGEFHDGFGTFYNSVFKGMQPPFLPDFLGAPMGYLLPWLEIVFGFLFLIGLLTRVSAVVLALLLTSFTMALIYANHSIAGGGPGAFHSNVLLIAICLIVLAAGPGKLSVDALASGSQRDVDATL